MPAPEKGVPCPRRKIFSRPVLRPVLPKAICRRILETIMHGVELQQWWDGLTDLQRDSLFRLATEVEPDADGQTRAQDERTYVLYRFGERNA